MTIKPLGLSERPRRPVCGRGICRLALLSLLLGACSRSVPPGVLTLAPAAMRHSDRCIANRDGSLDLPLGAVVDSTAFADAGHITLAVSAHALQATPVTVVVQVNGDHIGDVALASNESKDTSFEVPIRHRGPQTLRFEITAGPQVAAAMPLIQLKKVVIRQ